MWEFMKIRGTVKMLYKNPLFKNLSPYPGGIRNSPDSGCFNIKNLKGTLVFGVRFLTFWVCSLTKEI